VAQLASSITTSRLTLRRFEHGDLDALCAIYADERVARYLYWDVRDRETTRDVLERKIGQPTEIVDDNVLPVAVVLRDSGELIGDFMLRWTRNEHRQGETGGSLLPAVHGRGFATEVYAELVTVGFTTFNLHRVFANCDGRNHASIRSLEKAGLAREAHLIENEFVKGEWTDEVILAIRRDQWERQRAQR
jgi:RimJ/RimL family protein N-acetyltransferase